jgi:hypothetical protein
MNIVFRVLFVRGLIGWTNWEVLKWERPDWTRRGA